MSEDSFPAGLSPFGKGFAAVLSLPSPNVRGVISPALLASGAVGAAGTASGQEEGTLEQKTVEEVPSLGN